MTWRNGHVPVVHDPHDHAADSFGGPPRMGTGGPLTVAAVRRALATEKPKGLYVVSPGTAVWALGVLGRPLRTLGDLAEAMGIEDNLTGEV